MNAESISQAAPDKLFSSGAEGGFSLIEVMIALAIFAIGMLGVVSLQSTAVQNNSFSNGVSQAMREINQSEAERLISLSMSDADLNPGDHGPATSADGIYTTSYTVTDDSPSAGCKEVVVTTNWTDFKGNHSVALTFVKDSTL